MLKSADVLTSFKNYEPIVAPEGEPVPSLEGLNIAVLIPCLNEEATIGQVVHNARKVLPSARIFICDNGSTDHTVEFALASGAQVHHEALRGKGNAVRRMFADIEADVFVLVDGDSTYDVSTAPKLVRTLVSGGYDMVTTSRVAEPGAFRRFDRLGVQILTWLVRSIFGDRISDLLSGYRVFSRRFVKTFPALSHGFEIETELSIHALELRMPIAEVRTSYRERPARSRSKFRTVADGLKILATIFYLMKEERPLQLFAAVSFLLALMSMVEGVPVIENLHMGLTPRLSTAVFAGSTLILAFLSLACGLILDTVTVMRREMKRIFYLGLSRLCAGGKTRI
jgi:glycosyltransferase involved in cell wall biosynthesis